jgi:FlaG/FlaF family flagellin (archaellin)
MVAITVILAAVIAAFVFGMAGNIQKTKVVAATVSQQGSTVYVTYQGGQDDANVAYITAEITPSDGTDTNDGSMMNTVGKSIVLEDATSGQDRVVVTASFRDGTKQVIADTYV